PEGRNRDAWKRQRQQQEQKLVEGEKQSRPAAAGGQREPAEAVAAPKARTPRPPPALSFLNCKLLLLSLLSVLPQVACSAAVRRAATVRSTSASVVDQPLTE